MYIDEYELRCIGLCIKSMDEQLVTDGLNKSYYLTMYLTKTVYKERTINPIQKLMFFANAFLT